MNKIKNNPLKYVKIFSLVYLISSVVLETIYYALACSLFNHFSFSILQMVLPYVPFLFFLVYVFFIYGKNENHILLIISYIILAYSKLSSISSNIIYLKNLFLYETAEANVLTDIYIHLIINLSVFVFSIFCIIDYISAFRHLKVATVFVQTQLIVFGFSITILSTSTLTTNLMGNSVIEIILSIIYCLVELIDLIAIFTYFVFRKFELCENNEIFVEKSLYQFKRAYDKGKITSDEYNCKKESILNKY